MTLALESLERYEDFERLISQKLVTNAFTTSADEGALWGHFIMNIPEERRQHYNCNACKKFIQTYGGLVRIDEAGIQTSVFWSIYGSENVPAFFAPAYSALGKLVASAKVTGVFLSEAKVWGIPKTGDPKHKCVWTHLHFKPSKVYNHALLTAEQKMSEHLEEYKMLNRAIGEYPKAAIAEAIKILKAEAISQSEKALAIAEWFESVSSANNNQRWLAVATAPAGFCHVKNTILGTLLDDIVAGLSFDLISARWKEKVKPLTYQRAQVAPSAGTIKQAEDIVEKLGVAKSLERRFATLEDVKSFIWRPAKPVDSNSIFGHLKPKTSEAIKSVSLPPKDITWEKFAKTILPDAKNISLTTPAHGSYYGLVAAIHADAPNIFQWDNTVSWYFYSGGSMAHMWGLRSAESVKVNAILASPPEWTPNKATEHFGQKVFFALEGAKDVARSVGLALFSSTLKSEFYSIRSVVEAHSKTKTLAASDGNANGLAFQKGGSDRVTLDVDGATYVISRWD